MERVLSTYPLITPIGRNLATLVEVAARNQLLRSRGLNAARDLVERLERQLQEEETEPDSEEEPRSGEPR